MRGTRGPAGRLLAVSQSVLPFVRSSAGLWGPAIQSLPGGPVGGRAAPGPIPGQENARLGTPSFCLPVSCCCGSRPPPSLAAAPLSRCRLRRSLLGSFRRASGRSAAARRPGIRPSAARGERVRRGGPGAGGAGEEGEGKGRGRSAAGRRAASSAASPAPSRRLPPFFSPLLFSATARLPRSGALPPPRPVAWRDRQSLAGAQPRPAPAWAGGLPTPTLPCFFSISVARDGRLASLCPAGSEALSADPRPQLLTPVWTKSCPALCPRPRPWRAGAREGGRRGPGSRVERRAGPGPGPVRAATPESAACE